jgi:hypothetical protein
MAKLVSGLFKSRTSALLAVEDLMRHGCPQEDISMIMTHDSVGREFFINLASKAPEGAIAGAILGGAAFATLAFLVSTGVLTDPGWGIASVSPPFSLMAGFGLGSFAGMIAGGIIGSSMPEYEADLHCVDKKYPGIMVGVYCQKSRSEEAKKLLEASGGQKIVIRDQKTERLSYPRPREYAPVPEKLAS